jgi:hypothetical protein
VPASFVAADLDIGGSGSFTGVIDPAKGQMCYMLDAAGIGHPTAAKIEAAGAGASGQAVVTLQAPTGGSSGDCAAIPANVARDLLAHPKGYALVIDTAAYPGGALRAPLTSGGPRGAG